MPTDEAQQVYDLADRIAEEYGCSGGAALERAELSMFINAEYEIMAVFDPLTHVQEGCGCEPGESYDPRCEAVSPTRWAVVIDDAAHGSRFICWADQPTSKAIEDWEARYVDNAQDPQEVE